MTRHPQYLRQLPIPVGTLPDQPWEAAPVHFIEPPLTDSADGPVLYSLIQRSITACQLWPREGRATTSNPDLVTCEGCRATLLGEGEALPDLDLGDLTV